MSSAPLTEVRSVLIPLAESPLLLPNVVVAEVINYMRPDIRQGAPEWFLGDIAWRGTSVPVVSLEGLMGESIVEPGYRGRTIIMNTINGESLLPHIGIAAQAMPSLVRVTAESIQPSSMSEGSVSLVRQVVNIADKQAFIPDLDELERLVLDFITPE